MHLFLVENRSKHFASRIISFTAAIFVTDELCCEAKSTLPPYLGAQVARRYRLRNLPILNRFQVARANATVGLNVVMCFGGWDHEGLSAAQITAVREKQVEAFYLALSGYQIKEFLAEAIGDEALQWMVNSGAHIRRSYSRYFEKQGSPIRTLSRRSWLVGLTKQEALAHPGSHLSRFFVYTPPRFRFNRSEQSLLHHALMGETSAQLAALLSISPWTVKKRWQAIYQRVGDVDRELLPAGVANSLGVKSRGAERRRQLLYYLRQHPEELRPLS